MITLPDFREVPQEQWADKLNETLKKIVDELSSTSDGVKTAKSGMNPTGNLYFFPADRSRKIPLGYKESETITKFDDLIIAEKR